ncbi:MAG: peptide deformylase [Candidatus Pacebacteria bacterium]|nr:peptide deformylase [Candidatus Paceibacterota bacterium]
MNDSIVQIGDPVLKAVAKPVLKKDIASRKIQTLLSKMSKVLAKEGFGVALAAPQVGESLRIFVIAGKVFQPEEMADDKPTPPDRVFINPEFVRVSKATVEMTEGCLSVRHKYGSVVRHEKASVKALNEKGAPFIYHGSGLVAQIFQHEIDHLDGILYIDKAESVTDDENWQSLKEKRETRD